MLGNEVLPIAELPDSIYEDESLQHLDRCLLVLGNEVLPIAELPDSIYEDMSPCSTLTGVFSCWEMKCDDQEDAVVRQGRNHYLEK